MTDTEARASVQPLDVSDDATAAGQAVKDQRKMYLPAGAVAVTTQDQVVFGGVVYDVQVVRPWRSHTRVELIHED